MSESYCYENSVDKIWDDYEKEKRKRYDEFAERMKGMSVLGICIGLTSSRNGHKTTIQWSAREIAWI